MHLIEMSDYTLAPTGSGNGIRDFYFALAPGDVCAIEAQNPDDGHEFLRALATLSYPVTGALRWNGRRVRLKSYRALLGYKKRIGYIAPDAALISNLTVRQNILLHRYYVENDLGIDLDDRLAAMCDTFGISHKMDRRPADLNSMERQMAIVIREIGKKPDILLLDRPEDFIGHAKFEVLVELFSQWIAQGKPVVFESYDRRLVRRFATRKVLITNGSLTTVEIRKSPVAGEQTEI